MNDLGFHREARPTKRGRGIHVTNLIMLLLVVALAAGCSRSTSPGQAWERPWDCFRGVDRTYYGCTELSGDQQPTWSDWERNSANKLSIAYRCVSQKYEPEDDPLDFICEPEFSLPARQFDDGTAPRFHCFGTNDDSDDERVQFGCEPYWKIRREVRHQNGSGWFLWLALQANGEERQRLLAVANRMEEREVKEFQQEMNRTGEAGAKKSAPESSEIDQQKQVERLLRKWEQEDKARKSRTREEISRAVQREEDEWKSPAQPAPSPAE